MSKRQFKPLFTDDEEDLKPRNIEVARVFLPKQSIEACGGCLAWYAISKTGGVYFWYAFPGTQHSWQLSCVTVDDLVANSREVFWDEFFDQGLKMFPTRFEP